MRFRKHVPVAVVLEGPPAGKVAIVACDALMMVREGLDPVAEAIIAVFRRMRKELAPYQGEDRTTWLQVVLIGDREAYDLGGHQIGMGLHSYGEPGTGERIIDEVVKILNELSRERR